ncbi:cytochrome c [Cognatishimia sp. SS12]|uniref:c-type cytochrome n=1 Tax=Cognatishimia sp. SS12 TaxID=2979465 RepID=UPI002330B4E4|nr:cytochrome c [Cognatishimia sp. SS12]MDC0738816.1 cytochrome c [Cognatishimia sp. SS12]
MKRRTYVTLSILGLIAGSIGLYSEALVAPALAGHELMGREIAKGKALYDENCAACHGANLEGQKNWQTRDENGVAPAPPHDETGHTWHHDNQLLFDYTKLGGKLLLESRGIADFKSGMPGFQDVLSDEDIWDTLGYIRSTWPKRVQEVQDARNPPHE